MKDVASPPGIGILICKNVNDTKQSAAKSAVCASFTTVCFLFSIVFPLFIFDGLILPPKWIDENVQLLYF
mgnify:FL=1